MMFNHPAHISSHATASHADFSGFRFKCIEAGVSAMVWWLLSGEEDLRRMIVDADSVLSER